MDDAGAPDLVALPEAGLEALLDGRLPLLMDGMQETLKCEGAVRSQRESASSARYLHGADQRASNRSEHCRFTFTYMPM